MLMKLNAQFQILLQRTLHPDGSTGELFQLFKEEITPTLQNFLQKIDEKKTLFSLHDKHRWRNRALSNTGFARRDDQAELNPKNSVSFCYSKITQCDSPYE